MATKNTVDTRVNLSANLTVHGVQCTVNIEAGSAYDARTQLAGLLWEDQEVNGPASDPKSNVQATPSAQDQPATTAPSQAAATAPTEGAAQANPTGAPNGASGPSATQTAQRTPSQTAGAPTGTATPSAAETATPSNSYTQEQLINHAKALLAYGPDGEQALQKVLQAHGAQRVTTAPVEVYDSLYAAIDGELNSRKGL